MGYEIIGVNAEIGTFSTITNETNEMRGFSPSEYDREKAKEVLSEADYNMVVSKIWKPEVVKRWEDNQKELEEIMNP